MSFICELQNAQKRNFESMYKNAQNHLREAVEKNRLYNLYYLSYFDNKLALLHDIKQKFEKDGFRTKVITDLDDITIGLMVFVGHLKFDELEVLTINDNNERKKDRRSRRASRSSSSSEEESV